MAASIASRAVSRALRGTATVPLLLSRNKLVRVSPRRWLNLQEYQSKKLMQDCGVAVQRFFVADNASEAMDAAKRLNAKEIVLKAQILAGGRGKGVFDSGLKGGVHLTKDPAVVQELANKMLGFNLTTKQTPKEGVKVNTVMVAEALDISRETYFAILMDRACNGPVMVGSPQGGMDIEEEVIDIFEGVRDDQALRMAANLGFKGPLERQVMEQESERSTKTTCTLTRLLSTACMLGFSGTLAAEASVVCVAFISAINDSLMCRNCRGYKR
ncbi:Succinate--CoA ligase [GDP-forming] subunit beta, mitochondrial [Bagarius yarrelli]|uniref:Succinate--CoA ligase [GDP-forming] subunit beta, mitochondrial n=1 Tax=Bagarius yarrelli TaxID=175774 RepID=A0A556V9E8_BAGYA|nr:Succinate--CoA ligase [GDP-forming] subunit beta, mitochondrial [Bagarius yarrelli]